MSRKVDASTLNFSLSPLLRVLGVTVCSSWLQQPTCMLNILLIPELDCNGESVQNNKISTKIVGLIPYLKTVLES